MNKLLHKEQSLEKRKIRKDVQYLVNKGEPKQQILENLSHLYKDKITIVKQLEATPSMIMKCKFRIYNYILAVLLLVVLVLDIALLSRLQWGDWIIDSHLIINIALDVVFLISVLLFRIEIYSWIAARAVVTLLTILVAQTQYDQIDVLIFISLALIIASFVFGITLGEKLCPPRIPKIIQMDIGNDEIHNKTVFVFPD